VGGVKKDRTTREASASDELKARLKTDMVRGRENYLPKDYSSQQKKKRRRVYRDEKAEPRDKVAAKGLGGAATNPRKSH